MTTTFDHGYALLIGVGKCQYQQWSLPTTVQDMQALYNVLLDPALCGYPQDKQHVRLLHDEDATRLAILDNLAWLRNCAQKDPEATVIIFYSGHGKLDTATMRYYLIPHDYNPAPAVNLVFAAEDFHNAVRQIKAKRLLVFFDCCHAEGMASAKEAEDDENTADLTSSAMPEPLLKSLSQGEGRVVFSSSRGAQKSYLRSDKKMSIYTYHLIEALQGAGNQAGDTAVKVSNLMNYLDKTVPVTAATQAVKQKPFFDFATEDFPVAVLRGGKGMPHGGWAAVQDEATKKLDELTVRYQVTQNVTGDRNVVAAHDITGNVFNFGDDNRTSNDTISVGNISDSTGIAIGRDARADVRQIRDKSE